MQRTNLKLFRVARKMTQQEFADKMGVARSAYSLIETGDRAGKPDFWDRLQKTYEVPDAEMYGLMKCE